MIIDHERIEKLVDSICDIGGSYAKGLRTEQDKNKGKDWGMGQIKDIVLTEIIGELKGLKLRIIYDPFNPQYWNVIDDRISYLEKLKEEGEKNCRKQ